ncbi:MAG: hypothetical protein WD021_03895 [Rhodothermales bacterium]
MPALARLWIKTALGYMVAALLLGVWLAAEPWLPVWIGSADGQGSVAAVRASGGLTAALRAVFVHLFVVGWLTQLIFGVAYWLFPRHSREEPYGRSEWAWLSFGLLNGGLLLRAAAEPARAVGGSGFWAWSLVVAALLQWIATVCYAAYIWTRVRTK